METIPTLEIQKLVSHSLSQMKAWNPRQPFIGFPIYVPKLDNSEIQLQTKEQLTYSGLEELVSTETMLNYNEHIVNLAIKYCPKPKTCFDFGAGIGTLSLIFREKFGIEPECIEIDQTNISYLSERRFTQLSSLNDASKQADLIFSSNVLEHIEDDTEIMAAMNEHLHKDGYLFLYLPAHMILWSEMDDAVGHYRRYSKAELRQKLTNAGLQIERMHYADSIGFIASLLMKYLGHNAETGLGSVSSLKFYDRFIFPISRALDNLGMKYVIGKNIVVSAKKR